MIKYIIGLYMVFCVLNSGNLLAVERTYKEQINGKQLSFYKNRAVVTFKYELSDIEIKNIEKQFNIKILKPILAKEQSIKNTVKSPILLMSAQNKNILAKEEPLLRTYTVEFDAKSPTEFINNLKKNQSVIQFIEKYELPQLLYKPNDPRVDSQTFLNLIKAYDLWDMTKGDTNIIIGISDSGVEQDHEDLKSNLAINYSEIPFDNIDNDNNGYVDDYNGYNFAYNYDGVNPSITTNNLITHGLQVAGIAGASTDNAKGISGVGFNSKILPIKIIEGTSLVYAYQSIIYAATRGVKVLNLSWGSPKSPSDIDQLIIDYAVSKDVAIVASAGNLGSGNSNTYSSFYPATYKGVLGVGEVNSNGNLTKESILGVGTRIMAPGVGNYTTESGSSYAVCSGGSSFSSPVVTGAVALTRALYPELSAIQSIEFVRQCVDTFLTNNDKYYKLTPGILNMKKIGEIQPMSIPAVRPEQFIYFGTNNQQTDRFEAGDIAKLNIKCKNYLGNANNLTFKLSKAYDPANSVDLMDTTFIKANLSAGEEFNLENFRIAVSINNPEEVILRIDIYGENGYHDFFKFGFVPYQQISTFSNNNFFVSMADNGEFGYFTEASENGIGKGMGSKADGNQIYQNSTLMVSVYPNKDNAKIVFNDWEIDKYDFKTEKKFSNPQNNLCIINDENAGSERINVKVSQEVKFPSQSSNSVKLNLKVENTGNEPLSNLAIGYYIDWDIAGEAMTNRTDYFPVAIPAGKSKSATVQIAYINEQYPYYGSGAISSYENVSPQAAGIEYSYFQDFEPEERIATLNGGNSIQTAKKGDIASVIGMRFEGDIPANDSRECSICFARGATLQEFAVEMRNCLNSITSVEDKTFSLDIYPNPAKDFISFNSSEEVDFSIYSILGMEQLKGTTLNGRNVIDISKLQAGVYFIKIGNNINKIIKN
ncbi:MAG TPA: S8/S53 family peptidase [Candidatus Kapabacteria bacterium]|nr:S8/S53 family peptidase [Candidatus Kapabacteria bacterium]